MGSIQWLAVPISQLEIGLPLRYDIYNQAGDHLANAGDEFAQSQKASWIQLGFGDVYAKVCTPLNEDALLQPYDQAALQALRENVELISSVVLELGSSRTGKLSVTSMEFDELSSDVLRNVQADSAAALLVLAHSILNSHAAEDKLLADRCSQLAILSMAIAYELGLVPSECGIVGTAAMLHDVSLMGNSQDADGENADEYYRQHPIQSSNIVDSLLGINPKVAMAVSQVHEMPLGDGFPRGLRANRISQAARIICLADIYLTLTSSRQPSIMPVGRGFHPADAIGYIMYHTALGQFAIETVKALIRVSSLYPIGSRVQLSDDSTATVFRSSGNVPSKPIVRLDSSQDLIDLRQSSLTILGPDRSLGNYNPLYKSDIAEVMWE